MNKYEKLGVIGEGVFGVVLKCRHKDTEELVAIKKFKEQEDEEEEVTKKITLREVKLLRALKHENIVDLKEAFRRKGVLYLVFEYLDQSVMDVLEANSEGVGLEIVQTLIYQLLKALEHCHRLNVIHRDIKPENLLVDSAKTTLRLCDFGCARQMKAGVPLTDYVATRWYRAPELVLSTTDYGKGVDIWSVGCILGELTDGQPLFAGKSDVDQLSLIQRMLGPLTARLMDIRLQHSDFKAVKIPDVSQPVTLQKRYEGKMPERQIALLESFLMMDADQRPSAKVALRSDVFQKMRALHRDTLPSKEPKQSKAPQSKNSHTVEESMSPLSGRSAHLEISPRPAHVEASPRLPHVETSLPVIGSGVAAMSSSDMKSSFYGRSKITKRGSQSDLRTAPEDAPVTWDDDFADFHADTDAVRQPLQRRSTPQVDMYRLPWETSSAAEDLGLGATELTRSPTPTFGNMSQSGFFAGLKDPRSTGTRVVGLTEKSAKATLAASGRWPALGLKESRWSGA